METLYGFRLLQGDMSEDVGIGFNSMVRQRRTLMSLSSNGPKLEVVLS